jgi:hypothetical protein
MRPPARAFALLSALLLSASTVSACTESAPTPGAASSTPTPTLTATPGPTATPSPADTATPSPTTAPTPAPAPSPTARRSPEPAQAQLPRGGRSVFPTYRLVGYSGLTGAATLGRLGTGDLDQRLREIERRAEPYAAGRRILPVAEIIATIVHPEPGRDGMFRGRLGEDQIDRYLEAARRHQALLLLNIQPGRADFLDEVQAFEKFLVQPDVGVALDPEWAMDRGDRPGAVFGHTTGRELDTVAEYLSGLAAEHDLPEKVMVVHELAPSIITRESRLRDHRGVAVVKSIDGIGSRGAKEATYRAVWRGTPDFVRPGFKLFFTEDRRHGRLMTPRQVLALKPRPDYVLYE